MLIKNTRTHFGLIAISLHWLMAILLIGLLILGLYMVRLPISLAKLKLYGWHKEFGMLALLLVIVRVSWRWINLLPNLALKRWEVIAARFVHFALYFCMFAMPLSGWVITSAAGLPVSFFRWFTFPNLTPPNEETRILFMSIHEWLGYTLIFLIFLHTSAALKHHFINKDNILNRMLPWKS